MTNLFYALLFLVSGVGSLVIARMAWQRRPMAGAAPLTVVMLSMVIWAWASGAYWTTPVIDMKLLWLKFAFIGMVVSSPAFMVMVVEFTGHSGWLKPGFYLVLSFLPIVALLLLWTNDWFSLSFVDGMDILQLEKRLRGGIGFQLAVTSGYLNTLFGLVLMVRSFFRQNFLQRSQIGVLLIGSSIPIIPNIISLLKPSLFQGLDLTPISFSISGLFYIYGLLHFGIMDLAPMGRDAVLEKMEDGVLVIDNYGRVIDLNPMARTFMDKDVKNPIGKPMADVFNSWMNNIGLNNEMKTGAYRVQVEGPDFYHYDISVRPLLDLRGNTAGRLFVWRDISMQKRSEIEMREMNIRLKHRIEEVEQLHGQLHELAIRDGLTGLFNRRYMEETLQKEMAQAIRSNRPLSVVMIDIDRFKSLNDTYGHQTGDAILQALGKLLLSHTRAGDIACRYGGDELLVVMPEATETGAALRADLWRDEFSKMDFAANNISIHTTLSLGVASLAHGFNRFEELLAAADKSLYFSKLERNSVHIFDPARKYKE